MISVEHHQYLRKVDVFKHLTTEQFDTLAAKLTFREIPKHHILFFEGDPRTRIYFIKKGFAKIEQYDTNDTFLYLDYVKENNLFPYGDLFTDQPHRYTVTAITEMEVFYVPVAIFEELSLNNMKQMIFLLTNMSKILRFHELKSRNLVQTNARDRVVQTLTLLFSDLARQTGRLPFDITVVDIAKMSGTTRETTGNILKQLNKEKIIHYKQKQLEFVDTSFFLKNLH